MKHRHLLVVVLVGLAVVGVSGVAAQLGLRNDGVEFPDGSVQTSAAGTPGEFVQGSFELVIQDFQECGLGNLYAVPPGKRLRMDWMGFEISEMGGDDFDPVDIDIRTWLGGSQVAHPIGRMFGAAFIGTSLFKTARISGPVQIYNQGGTTVQIFSCRNNDTDETSVLVTFHGQLFDE